MHRAAGRPIPTLSDDPVIDFMVLEAIHLKVQAEAQEAEKVKEIKDWKGDISELKKHI